MPPVSRSYWWSIFRSCVAGSHGQVGAPRSYLGEHRARWGIEEDRSPARRSTGSSCTRRSDAHRDPRLGTPRTGGSESVLLPARKVPLVLSDPCSDRGTRTFQGLPARTRRQRVATPAEGSGRRDRNPTCSRFEGSRMLARVRSCALPTKVTRHRPPAPWVPALTEISGTATVLHDAESTALNRPRHVSRKVEFEVAL